MNLNILKRILKEFFKGMMYATRDLLAVVAAYIAAKLAHGEFQFY